jgi:ribosomal protein L31
MTNTKVLQKLAEAKQIIRNTTVKKKGKNTFSNYEYFLPSQITELVQDACSKNGLVTMFNTQRDSNRDIFASLTVSDIDSGESVTFNQVTAIPEIKATNLAQQLGGLNTYSSRYLMMFAFDITEDGLDFDSTANTKAQSQAPKRRVDSKPVLTESHPKWADIIKFVKAGGTLNDITTKYVVSSDVQAKLGL